MRLLRYRGSSMRAVFYIDGFNFYFLRTKRQPHLKWLNLKALANQIVPRSVQVDAVNYYTADVSGKFDFDAPRRQKALFDALSTVPEVQIHKGKFLYSEKWAGLVHPAKAKPDGYSWTQPEPEVVLVKKAEEKGSDVNLGVHLVRDGFVDKYDIAYVLTNDTDLVEPIRIVTEELNKKVCIVAPCRPMKRGGRTIPVPAVPLKKYAAFVHYIDDKELMAAQFPSEVIKLDGTKVIRPATWV
jgi:uncharacterized LabA/DUF88 family protein